MAAETTEKFTAQKWAYTGRRLNRKGKLVDAFIPLDNLELAQADRSVCYKADKRAKSVGGVYTVEATPDGTKAKTSTAKFHTMYDDKVRVLGWKANHDATMIEVASAAAEKRCKTNGDALAALEPIRELWQRSIGTNRLTLEVAVLNYLRTGAK